MKQTKETQIIESAEGLAAMTCQNVETLKMIRVVDDSEVYGFLKDDIALIQQTDFNDENRVSVWRLRKSQELIYGFAYDNFGDISITCETNVTRFKKREIEFVGIVVGVRRFYNAGEVEV